MDFASLRIDQQVKIKEPDLHRAMKEGVHVLRVALYPSAYDRQGYVELFGDEIDSHRSGW